MEETKETTHAESAEQERNESLEHDVAAQGSEESLANPLAVCKAEVAQWKDRFARVSADLENFKRRTQKEQQTWFTLGQRQLAKELLDIVDTMERALQDNAQSSDDQMLKGVQLMYKNMQKLLEKFGVKEITEVDEFNPELHEGLMQVDSDTHESGDIVEILQKGYWFKDEVLRPAKVSVAK